jgi:transposase
MFFPGGQVRVFLYDKAVSMHLFFAGLYVLARNQFQQDPLSGNLLAFINRHATQIKVLYFDRTGLCVCAKRLEQGGLLSDWREVTTCEMDWTALKCLLEGITPQRVKKRYQRITLASGIKGWTRSSSEDVLMRRSSTSPPPDATTIAAITAPALISMIGKREHEIIDLPRQIAWFQR